MYKNFVFSTLLLLSVFYANNLLLADEGLESNTEKTFEAVTETEAKVEEAATTISESEAIVEESAVTVMESEEKVEGDIESAGSKTGEVLDAAAEAGAKAEEAVVTLEKSEAEREGGAATVVVTGEKAERNIESAVSEKDETVESVAKTKTKVEEAATVLKKTESAVKESSSALETEVKNEEETSATVKTEKNIKVVEENDSDVIAKVNDEKIIRKDFDRRLNVFRRLNQNVTRPVKMQIVDQLTKKLLLKQFIEEKNIEVDKDEIQEELEKIKYFLQNNPNNTDKSLEEILENQGSNVVELEDEVKRTLALSKYLESTVNDDDKKNYFNANKNAFNGARVKASHVLIDTRGMKTEDELEEAERMIKVIKMEIDKGADFAEMAKKYSNCPSADKGGDIGFFQRKGSIVEEFAKVAFEMNVGDISDPVKTQFGYHIIKVTEKENGQDVSYEDVSDMVDFVYMQMKTEDLLKELHDKAKIEIFL